MNYDHLKQQIIKPGILVLDDNDPELKDTHMEGYCTCDGNMEVKYKGNSGDYANISFGRNMPKIEFWGLTKKELLCLSKFLKDIAETL